MRLWSIHPSYLDPKGLVALWREALLAKHVLEGRTKGYRNHPQLQRFRSTERPVDAINQYLATVHDVSVDRSYDFDARKFIRPSTPIVLPVARGQLDFEIGHLLKKLEVRDLGRNAALKAAGTVMQHPLFVVVEGEIEPWELG